jgi:hypothetical protein
MNCPGTNYPGTNYPGTNFTGTNCPETKLSQGQIGRGQIVRGQIIRGRIIRGRIVRGQIVGGRIARRQIVQGRIVLTPLFRRSPPQVDRPFLTGNDGHDQPRPADVLPQQMIAALEDDPGLADGPLSGRRVRTRPSTFDHVL